MVDTISSIVALPVVVTIGILVNHNYPNIIVLIALVLIVVAILIRTTQNKKNKRHLLKYSVFIVIALMFANQVGHAFDGAFYKNVLHLLSPETVLFGIAVYMLTTSLTLNIIYFLPIFKKQTAEEKKIIQKNSWIAYAIPTIWFIASLPEGYSFA